MTAPARTPRIFPSVGMVRWICWCGAAAKVSGDTSDDTGWAFVRTHREEHRDANKRRKS